MSGFKSNQERDLFRQNNMFTIKPYDKVEFYFIPLQIPGGNVLASAGKKHLLMVVTSRESGKQMNIGFYPEGGNILGAIHKPKNGWVWSPDPHYLPDIKGFEKAKYYGTEQPVIYQIDGEQADALNEVFKGENCKLKDGSTSRGKVKRDRLECPHGDYKYQALAHPEQGFHNCVTWLYMIFPNLAKDITGKDVKIVNILDEDQVLSNMNMILYGGSRRKTK